MTINTEIMMLDDEALDGVSGGLLGLSLGVDASVKAGGGLSVGANVDANVKIGRNTSVGLNLGLGLDLGLVRLL